MVNSIGLIKKMESELIKDSVVRGHICIEVWSPIIGHILQSSRNRQSP